MSDEIITIATPYGDVAELAQGYINRVDGERILLPLPLPCAEGGGVRYVVQLADGTPAFAGAGRCAQVSDQGDTVPPSQRFETLVDSLQFDERSRPVYDYIVAIRNQAYAEQGQGGEAMAADAAVEVDAVEVAEGEALPAEAVEVAAAVDFEDEPTAFVGAPSAVAIDGESAPPDAGDAFEVGVEETVDAGEAPELVPSVRPEAIPTGILQRPARAVHWAPSPPRRPTPRPASGLFTYNGGGLPVPARPPYPDLDPAYFIPRAPHPSAGAVAAGAAVAGAAGYAEATAEGYAEPDEIEAYDEVAAGAEAEGYVEEDAYAEAQGEAAEVDDEAFEGGPAPTVADTFAPEASPAAEGYVEEATVIADEGYGDDEGYVEEATVVADEGYEEAFHDDGADGDDDDGEAAIEVDTDELAEDETRD